MASAVRSWSEGCRCSEPDAEECWDGEWDLGREILGSDNLGSGGRAAMRSLLDAICAKSSARGRSSLHVSIRTGYGSIMHDVSVHKPLW